MKLWRIILSVLIIAGTAATVSAQEPFYRGKTVRIIVGFSAGGGFDTYSRVIARHLGKHIPGNPTIIVENMTGAGSLIAANHLYRVAKPDGLAVGHFIGGLLLGQVLDQKGIQFDARKFEYIGVPVKDHLACAFSKASGITSVERWMASKTPVKMGGIAPGNSTPDNVTRIIKTALNLPIQLVTGYKGTADIRLAVDGGELAGGCWGWDSIAATWRKGLDAGDVLVVLQGGRKAHSDLPKVPLAGKLAKTDEGRQLIGVGIDDESDIRRPYVLPPGTPKDRVKILQQAFIETLRDPEFLKEAHQAKLGVDPVSGEEVERIVAGLFKLSPALIARLKEVLYD
jgi:tripartite-type tricarboxylate transporter receptor subunit TctC